MAYVRMGSAPAASMEKRACAAKTLARMREAEMLESAPMQASMGSACAAKRLSMSLRDLRCLGSAESDHDVFPNEDMQARSNIASAVNR